MKPRVLGRNRRPRNQYLIWETTRPVEKGEELRFQYNEALPEWNVCERTPLTTEDVEMVERPEEGPDQGTYREWDAEYARRSLIWSKRFISALIEGRRKGKISKKKEAEARKEASKLVRVQRRYNKWSRETLYCDESLDEGTDVEMNEEDPEENPVMTLTVSEEISEPATEATPTTTTPPT